MIYKTPLIKLRYFSCPEYTGALSCTVMKSLIRKRLRKLCIHYSPNFSSTH